MVEGKEDVGFFISLFNSINLTGVQIIPLDGKDKTRAGLTALRNLPGFDQVVALGIVRDADRSAANTFKSVQGALRDVGLSYPQRVGVPRGRGPRVGVFLLPGHGAAGMLEDLCLRSVADKPQFPCIDRYFRCVNEAGVTRPNQLAKAKLHVFLASQKKPGLRLGQAARAGYWPFENMVFLPLKRFLQKLYG